MARAPSPPPRAARRAPAEAFRPQPWRRASGVLRVLRRFGLGGGGGPPGKLPRRGGFSGGGTPPPEAEGPREREKKPLEPPPQPFSVCAFCLEKKKEIPCIRS